MPAKFLTKQTAVARAFPARDNVSRKAVEFRAESNEGGEVSCRKLTEWYVGEWVGMQIYKYVK